MEYNEGLNLINKPNTNDDNNNSNSNFNNNRNSATTSNDNNNNNTSNLVKGDGVNKTTRKLFECDVCNVGASNLSHIVSINIIVFSLACSKIS